MDSDNDNAQKYNSGEDCSCDPMDGDLEDRSMCEIIFAECACAWLEANAIRVLNAQMDAAKAGNKRTPKKAIPPVDYAGPLFWCNKCKCKHVGSASCFVDLK